MKTRQSNFELLRIVSIMMIQALHIVGVVHNNENISFLNVQVESFINCFCNVGVTCFILISGWFGIQRKADKLLELLIIAIVYSIICASVTNEWSLLNTIVVPSWHILSLDNWFLGCYIVVTLIAPWLNTIAETFSRDQFRNLLLTLAFILGVVTTLFHSPNGSVIYWGGKSLGWFTTTYLIGRYLRLYYKNGLDINMSVKMIVVPFFIMYGFCFLVSCLPAPFNDRHGYLTRDSSPLMLIEAIGVFFLFNSFRIKSRLINWSASSAFALYLLGGGILVLDKYIFHVKDNADRPYLLLLVIGEVLAISLSALIIDKTFRFLFGNVLKFLINNIVKFCRVTRDKVSPFIQQI